MTPSLDPHRQLPAMHHDSLRSVLKALGITAGRHDPQRRIHTASRRLFLGGIGSAVIARTVGVVPSSAALSGVELDRKLGEELDEALTMLAPYAPSYRGGAGVGGAMVKQLFDTEISNGELLSEDYLFCRRYRSSGGTVWLAPWCQIGHMGTYRFGG